MSVTSPGMVFQSKSRMAREIRLTISTPPTRTDRRSPSRSRAVTGPAATVVPMSGTSSRPVNRTSRVSLLTINHLAAVDRDHCSGHESTERAQKENYPSGEFLGQPDPSERDLAPEPPMRLREVVRPGGVDRCVDRSGGHAIHTDSAARQLARQGRGE